ncbi:hypothetical protein D3C78_1628400 [compost metagenome]
MGKPVTGVDPDKPARHIFDHRNGLAIDPAALQGRDITGNAEHAMAVGTIAFGAGAVLRQHPGDVA